MKKLILLFCFLCIVQPLFGVQIKMAWDAPATSDANGIDGYNFYQASLPDPVTGAVIYIRINQTPILLTEYTVDVQPGQRFVVRSFNILGESADSNMLIVPSAPPPPPLRLRFSALTVQSSSDLAQWDTIDLIPLQSSDRQFFRMQLSN